MRQSKKLLSILLAMIMVFSSVSVIANARAEWLDSAVSYNGFDKPVLTTEQYATAALDEVDRMLAEEEIILTEEEIFVGTLDATSVDNALDSVNTILNGTLWTKFNSLLGDLKNLNISALNKRRRANSDLEVINSLLQFLYDNKGLFVDFVKGDLDLGKIVGQFVDLSDFSVQGLAKSALYEATYGADAPDTVSQSVDTMVQDLIDNLLINGMPNGDGTRGEPVLPAAAGYTNISSGSTYDFLDKALKIAYNEYFVERANRLWINDINELIAQYPEEIEKYKQYFNLKADGTCNFTFQPYQFTSASFISQLNNVIASVVNLVLADDIGFSWQTGSNSMIVTNIINIGKEVLVATGDTFFSSFVEVKTPAELDAMTDMEVVSYVARTIINSSIRGVWVPETADNLVKVANYTIKGLMATQLPGRDYSSESAYPVNSVNTIYNILADFAVKALNENPGLGLSYGIGLDAVATAGANWAIEKYSGLLSGINLNTASSGWSNLDKVLKAILDNYSWFDASVFPNGTVTAESLIKDVIIGNVLNLNFDPFFQLLDARPAGSELNGSIKQVILKIVPRILNIVFPNLLSTSMTSFDDLIAPANLGSTVNAIFTDLYSYRTPLVAAVLPIVCDALDLTTEQVFRTPSFDIEDFYCTSAANISFKITNRSSGINTAYTASNGRQYRDSRYAIKLEGITATRLNPTGNNFNVTLPSQKTIYGGQSVSATITGTVGTTNNVLVEITYNVLTEDGSALTSTPLVARIYTCISKTDTDEKQEYTSTSGNILARGGFKNIYTTSVSGLDDVEYKFKNNTTADISVVGYSENQGTSTLYKNLTDLSFVKVNNEARTIIPGGTVAYQTYVLDGYTGTEEQDAEAYGPNGFTRYYTKISGVINGTTKVGSATNILLYKDYGLTKLFYNEVSAQRQASDYNASAFAAYQAAMNEAAMLIMTKKAAAQFCATTAVGIARKYEGVATALEAAVTALKESAVGGVESTQALVDQYDPSNEGKVYTDADYSYFSAYNYMAYTFSNFRDEYKAANSFINKYTPVLDETTGEMTEPGTPSALDVAYKNHRLTLYYNRLRPVAAQQTVLVNAINAANAKGYVAADYTEDSWAAYQTALGFATSVKNAGATGKLQAKVNKAYEELIEAQKRLTAPVAEGGEVVIEIADVNPYDESFAPIVIEEDGVNYLLGVAPETEIEAYFSVTGDVTFEYDMIATGSTITIYDSNNNVVGEYVMVVKGDVDGSGEIDTFDATDLSNVAAYYAEFEVAANYAADVDNSGDVTTFDATDLSNVAAYYAELNFADVG